jgi:hypothetical protein
VCAPPAERSKTAPDRRTRTTTRPLFTATQAACKSCCKSGGRPRGAPGWSTRANHLMLVKGSWRFPAFWSSCSVVGTGSPSFSLRLRSAVRALSLLICQRNGRANSRGAVGGKAGSVCCGREGAVRAG